MAANGGPNLWNTIAGGKRPIADNANWIWSEENTMCAACQVELRK